MALRLRKLGRLFSDLLPWQSSYHISSEEAACCTKSVLPLDRGRGCTRLTSCPGRDIVAPRSSCKLVQGFARARILMPVSWVV